MRPAGLPSGGTEAAAATIASLALGPRTSGRPERGLSKMPGMPCSASQRRQSRTVHSPQPRSRAIAAFSLTSAAARVIGRAAPAAAGSSPGGDDLPQLPLSLDGHPHRHHPGTRHAVLLPCHADHGRVHPHRGGYGDIRPGRRGTGIPASRRHW